jgi:hypothetical protein
MLKAISMPGDMLKRKKERKGLYRGGGGGKYPEVKMKMAVGLMLLPDEGL